MALIAASCAGALVPGPWSDVNDTPKKRAEELLANMTLPEKLAMLHGPPTGPCCQCTTDASCAYVGNIIKNDRLGIPPVNMNDGPQVMHSIAR
jgi:beta-glucosidase